LGVLVAATAGWIGYMIQQSLENALSTARSPRSVATVITQVVVDRDDPALKNPTKFIGRGLSRERAKQVRAEGHIVKVDGHGKLRGSSEVRHRRAFTAGDQTLVEHGVSSSRVAAARAVSTHEMFGWEGLDAVVDKDLAAAVLARDLGAELFDFDGRRRRLRRLGNAQQRPLRRRRPTKRTDGRTEGVRRGAWRRKFERRSISFVAPADRPSSPR
jgi:carbamate kinase